jgi:hypothetical protein
MAQIFSRTSNTFARVSLVGGTFALFGLIWANYTVYWAPWTTRQCYPLTQEVPFSHKHHVTDDGIDCRYCHTSVENSAFAGVPETHICMTCHSQLWTDAPMLSPDRLSLALNNRLRWRRVYDLPDFVFFDHSIHIHKGVGCSSCHGEVDQMPLMWKAYPVYMKWCLDCHSNPADQLRPTNEVYNLQWQKLPNQQEAGQRLVKEYSVQTTQLTDCSMCHR